MDQGDKSAPNRFEVYNLLPDGKSFTIPNCKFVFKLDRFGGWKDEHGQYFNEDGEPEDQPEDAELTPSEGSVDSHEKYHDEYDEYAPETYDDDEDDDTYHVSAHQARRLQKISKNMEILRDYPAGKMIRVAFSNMPFKFPPKSIFEAYTAKVDGIINIDFELDQKYRRNGKGNFIMKDAAAARELVKLEDERITQREVSFIVESFQELSMYPIKQSEMTPCWNPKSQTKTQATKPAKSTQPAQPARQFFNSSIQQKPKVEEKKEEKKEQKKEEKKEEKVVVPQFQLCTLNFQVFPKKTDFFTWIKKWDGERDRDIKNIDKKQQNGKTVISMEVRSTILQKCNGQTFEGKKVEFTKLQNR